jgi:hypothetical protein
VTAFRTVADSSSWPLSGTHEVNVATWILILFAHVGSLGNGNSNALTSVPGFQSEGACRAAGSASATMASGTVKIINFVCVKDR